MLHLAFNLGFFKSNAGSVIPEPAFFLRPAFIDMGASGSAALHDYS
jgi:hypothetical protein